MPEAMGQLDLLIVIDVTLSETAREAHDVLPAICPAASATKTPSSINVWARMATVHWIEAIYNRQRRHSGIDMMSPVDYEDRYWNRRAAA